MKKQGKRVQVDSVYIAAKFELVKVRRTVASGMETSFTGMEEFATKAPYFLGLIALNSSGIT